MQTIMWLLRNERVQTVLFILAFIALCVFLYFSGDGEGTSLDCTGGDGGGYGWCYEPEPEPRPYD